MHPVVFALALIVAGGLALLLTAAAFDAPSGVMPWGMAALLWVAVLALAWTRWVRRPARWLGRVAAAIGLAMLAATVYAWMQQADVFVEYRRNCPPRAGTFWKLVIAWLGGVAAINYVLFGSVIEGMATRRLRDLRSRLNLSWWGAIAAWTAACACVFVRNISTEVALRSLKTLGLGVGNGLLYFVAIVGAIAGVVWLVSIPARKRRKQAQADYLALDAEYKRGILDRVDRHARSVAHCLYYREGDAAGWDVRKPHVGGSVLMPAGEAWPVGDDGQPALFLLQLPLPDTLPAPWPGRVLSLWLSIGGFDVQARSHDGIDGLVERRPPPWPKEAPFALVAKRNLLPLALPVPRTHDDEAEGDPFCELLLKECAGLKTALEAVTTQPGAVLAKILADDARVDYLEPGAGVWVGGEPQLIQNPHDPRCEICGQPMRFLFSAGDVTGESAFGDVGVAYVYGCDAHPQHCQGFVDCH